MNWIKISTAIGDDPRIGRIADACRCSGNEALGAVVRILGRLPEHAPNGDLSGLPSTLIEQWAWWRGKAGKFADAFRAEMCDESGVVRSWEKWNGSAQRQLVSARERMANLRQAKREQFAERSQNVPETFASKKEREKEREKESNYEPIQKAVVDTPPAPAAVLPWVHPDGHQALAVLFSAVPHVETWVGLLRGFASGTAMDHNRPCDPRRLAAAVQDFVGAGKHLETDGPSPHLFRGFVKRAKAPEVRHTTQQTEAEYRAETLQTLRRQNERRARLGQPEKPEPAWAKEIDAMFPDGRTKDLAA